MIAIDLDNLIGIPIEILERLQNFDAIFKENRFLENLLNNSNISDLIEDINDYCLKNQIFGYHYTRAIPNEIQKTGLICRKGDDIRNSFITNFGHNFTDEELDKIKKTWLNHFDPTTEKIKRQLLIFQFHNNCIRRVWC